MFNLKHNANVFVIMNEAIIPATKMNAILMKTHLQLFYKCNEFVVDVKSVVCNCDAPSEHHFLSIFTSLNQKADVMFALPASPSVLVGLSVLSPLLFFFLI